MYYSLFNFTCISTVTKTTIHFATSAKLTLKLFLTEEINQNSVAGTHEMRGEVIFKQQDSTRKLIQFFIALLIKTC